MIESIEAGRKEDGNRSIAEKIIKRLHDLDKTVENNQGRWAWELLQNAKDSIADEDRTVSIQIEFNEESVEFRHNGTHFTERDIRGVINQISSKEIEEGEHTKKTGRFGTGFLTTHLLSKVIQIKGIVKTASNDFYEFQFPLDRQERTTSLLIPKIENAWAEFHQSAKKLEVDYDRNAFNTSFCYLLDTEQKKEIAKIGLNEFSKLIPYVLAFIPKISCVEIMDNTMNITTTFKINDKHKIDPITTIEKIENNEIAEILILQAKGVKVAVATEVEKTEKGYSVKSIKNIPKLFCDFPLIGTESFHFPVIVNSFFFNPQTERDGIWLKCHNDDQEVIENQEILESAVELYKNLVSEISERDFFDLYNMAETKMPATNDKYFDSVWYKQAVQQPIREFIKQSKIVETEVEKVRLDAVRFPDPSLKKEDREKIWKFSSSLKVNKLPVKQHIHKWAEIIWNDCNKVDIGNLVIDLKDQLNITKLLGTLEMDEKQAFTWLNECIDFIYEIGGQDQFMKNELIPNQEGAFKSLKELCLDEIEDEVIKEIAKLVGYNFYNKLIHKDVFFECVNSKVNLQFAASEITQLLNSEKGNSEEIVLAIRKLTEWFEHNEEKGKNFFSDLYRKKEKLLVDTIEDKDNLYQILKNKTPLSTVVNFIHKIDENPKIIESYQELGNLLKEFDASDVSDLKRMLQLNKSGSIDIPKIEITKEILLSLGVASIEELKAALKDENIAAQFTHTSTPTFEMFEYVQQLIGRAKENIIKHLKSHPDYDCTEWEELANTVIGGIKKHEFPIHVVVRPSDNGQVIVYYSSEKDALDYENAELWTDNGRDTPRHLTLGKILKKTGINKIPV